MTPTGTQKGSKGKAGGQGKKGKVFLEDKVSHEGLHPQLDSTHFEGVLILGQTLKSYWRCHQLEIFLGRIQTC